MQLKVLVFESESFFKSIFDILPEGSIDYDGFALNKKQINNYDCFYYSNLGSLKAIAIASYFLVESKKVYMYTDGVFDLANALKNRFFNYKYNFFPYLNFPYSELLVLGKTERLFFSLFGIKVSNYKRKEQVKTMHNNTKPKFLVTTANTPYFDENEFKLLLKLLKDLKKISDKIQGVDFLWIISDKKLSNSLGIKPSKQKFIDIYKNIDGLITTPSTIILESMKLNIPTCTLIYREEPLFYSSGWNMFFGADYLKIIKQMKNKSFVNILYQESIVNNYYNESHNKYDKIIDKQDFFLKNQKQFHLMVSSKFLSAYNFNFESFLRRIKKHF